MGKNPIGVILVKTKKHGWCLLMADLEYDDGGAIAWAIPLSRISPVGAPSKMIELFKGQILQRKTLEKPRRK